MATREGFCSACLRCMLKLLNFVLVFVGVSLLLFSLWVLHKLPASSFRSNQLWFIYLLLGLGASICMLAFLGHFATDSANGCWLSCYAFSLVVLLMLQGAFTIETFLYKQGDAVMPDDPTGVLNRVIEFIEENLDVCKWAGLVILVMEALAAMLALCAKAAASSFVGEDFDDDDDDQRVYVLPVSASCWQPLLAKRSKKGSFVCTRTCDAYFASTH
ncbi:hypothetical protein GOP47_0023551 [Adiantum capillus-veneris]|uniref:Tetraspanin-19 n=1 Tax=Adiantum capillus-veneris TaxID=13818 RepID=A0A9D4Z611_ADICA|nr:hypothetical protein GOP47_0023551 [Adiantum capillus-veneris]